MNQRNSFDWQEWKRQRREHNQAAKKRRIRKLEFEKLLLERKAKKALNQHTSLYRAMLSGDFEEVEMTALEH